MVCFGFGFDPIGMIIRVEPNPKDLPSYDDFDVCVNGFLCCVGTYGDRKRNEAEEKSKRPGKRCNQGKMGKESSSICSFAHDMASHSACSFGGGKAERLALAKYRQVIWQGRVLKSQFTDEELRGQGRCPLTPEEIGLLLVALGFNNSTRLYLASHKVINLLLQRRLLDDWEWGQIHIPLLLY
ncbi:hypothetical protein POM88_000197 [Heracleum sosnowskyi]|uniref:O-fucosyltransferase family protein n=1 Tax=Heracleum sosnowskyi TaxID=360622 RepID=A0AAD8N940_9APIA|nr:hypothetical protein POM88_000197 [Heracleum sosnowskyi]